MMRWLIFSPSERRLLGGSKFSGLTVWVIAIMSFSITVVAAAGLALAGSAGVVADSAANRYSVQVPDGARQLSGVLRAVTSAPGVTSARAVPEAEMRQTLERWLGPAANSQDLPIPALIHFDLRPGTDVGAISRRIAAIAPSAKTVRHSETLGPLLGSLRAMQWLAFGLVTLLAAAAAAAVVLAARGALDTHRSTVDVMHGIGATDLQITRLFQRKIAIDALVGSVAGAAAAALIILLLVGGAAFVRDITGGLALRPAQVALLLVLPLALAALATGVARMAVLATLRRSL